MVGPIPITQMVMLADGVCAVTIETRKGVHHSMLSLIQSHYLWASTDAQSPLFIFSDQFKTRRSRVWIVYNVQHSDIAASQSKDILYHRFHSVMRLFLNLPLLCDDVNTTVRYPMFRSCQSPDTPTRNIDTLSLCRIPWQNALRSKKAPVKRCPPTKGSAQRVDTRLSELIKHANAYHVISDNVAVSIRLIVILKKI